MKCKVVLNEKGSIISIAYRDPKVEEESEEQPTLNSGPVIEENQKLVELDISEEYVRKPTAEIFRLIQTNFRIKKEL